MATDLFNNRTAMRLRAIIGAQKTNLSAMGKQLGKTRAGSERQPADQARN